LLLLLEVFLFFVLGLAVRNKGLLLLLSWQDNVTFLIILFLLLFWCLFFLNQKLSFFLK
jgi:hypothetical protein